MCLSSRFYLVNPGNTLEVNGVVVSDLGPHRPRPRSSHHHPPVSSYQMEPCHQRKSHNRPRSPGRTGAYQRELPGQGSSGRLPRDSHRRQHQDLWAEVHRLRSLPLWGSAGHQWQPRHRPRAGSRYASVSHNVREVTVIWIFRKKVLCCQILARCTHLLQVWPPSMLVYLSRYRVPLPSHHGSLHFDFWKGKRSMHPEQRSHGFTRTASSGLRWRISPVWRRLALWPDGQVSLSHDSNMATTFLHPCLPQRGEQHSTSIVRVVHWKKTSDFSVLRSWRPCIE